jgi:hypothetical protein
VRNKASSSPARAPACARAKIAAAGSPLKLNDGEPRVLPGGEDFLVLLDECTDERLSS